MMLTLTRSLAGRVVLQHGGKVLYNETLPFPNVCYTCTNVPFSLNQLQ